MGKSYAYGHPVGQLRSQFIAVAGSIATGKSGVVRRLSSALGATALLEEIGDNPYFAPFYDDPGSWAFHSQTAFAADSLSRHIKTIGSGAVIQDRTVYEVVDVFARLLHELGHLSSVDMQIFSRFRDCAQMLPRQPTLLIYLHAPVEIAMERVATRGRDAESHLTVDYLDRLDALYRSFIGSWLLCPVLSIDTAERDLRRTEEMAKLIAELPPSGEDELLPSH